MFGASAAERSFRPSWRTAADALGDRRHAGGNQCSRAELSNKRWRSVAVALMVVVIPSAESAAASSVQRLLGSAPGTMSSFSAAPITAAFIPIVWLLLPESVDFLDRQGRPGHFSHQPDPDALWPRVDWRADP